MRFPSLSSLGDAAWRSFRRFPIAIILAAKSTLLGIWWTHLSETEHFYNSVGAPPQWYWNAIVSCYLGMLLSVAATVWLEKGARGRSWAIGLQVGVLVLAGLYYWSLPPDFSSVMVIRTVVLALGLHWLIAVIGFGSGEMNGFWIFNKRLFLRMLTTFLYSLVLYIGISLGLLAIERLFNVDIHSEVYQDCWWVLGGLFSVWFFLAGFPRSYENPAEIIDYPKGLKIFTQYVLLTLVTIYLLILYAYIIKIILTRHWPVGWVAWMVMAFSVAGILSLLLIYPLRNEANSTWIRGYSKFFYRALLPLIIMLFIAIYKRVTPYGITEQRYFLLALAYWLLVITVYFQVSKKQDIRLVPLSLCLLAFLSCWGPWGAFSVSQQSQQDRLKGLLEKYGLMANGKIVAAKPDAKVAILDRKAISSVTEYFVDQHGYKALQPLFSQNLDSLMRSNKLTGRWQESNQIEAVMKLMNVPYTSRWATVYDTMTTQRMIPYFTCTPESNDTATLTAGATYLAKFSVGPEDSDWDFVAVGGEKLRIMVVGARNQLKFTWVSGGEELAVDLGPVAEKLLTPANQYGFTLPRRDLELSFSGQSLVGKILLTSIEGSREDNKVLFRRITGWILFSKK